MVPGLHKAWEKMHNLNAIIIDYKSLFLKLHDILQVGKQYYKKRKD
jgi:hypothetical protein